VRLVQKTISSRLSLEMLSASSAELGWKWCAHTAGYHPARHQSARMNGFDALRILQVIWPPRYSVVAISANAMERDIKKGLDAGFVDY